MIVKPQELLDATAALSLLAENISSGAKLGFVAIVFDHVTGQANLHAYNVGDPWRCFGIMQDVAQMMLDSQKRAMAGRSQILLPRQ